MVWCGAQRRWTTAARQPPLRDPSEQRGADGSVRDLVDHLVAATLRNQDRRAEVRTEVRELGAGADGDEDGGIVGVECGGGVLVIAGIPLSAQLPAGVGAKGETLRLSVSEVTPERVTLQLDDPPVPVAAPAAADPPAGRARLRVEDPPRTVRVGEQRATVALSFTSDALGRLDLRLEVGGGRVRAAVETPPGRSFDLADAAAGRLRDGRYARTGYEAEVRITPRRAPLDLYA